MTRILRSYFPPKVSTISISNLKRWGRLKNWSTCTLENIVWLIHFTGCYCLVVTKTWNHPKRPKTTLFRTQNGLDCIYGNKTKDLTKKCFDELHSTKSYRKNKQVPYQRDSHATSQIQLKMCNLLFAFIYNVLWKCVHLLSTSRMVSCSIWIDLH